MIAAMLVLCMLVTTASGATATKEVYVSDLRLIYADNYNQATQVLKEAKLEGYKVLNQNLNRESKETGTWLAYKTTTDVEDAITDIAVMQMDGGYNLGNFQEMIKQSRENYEKMGTTYLAAIDYFAEAYNADNFLSQLAYRQLNFYTGLDKRGGQLLGDVFVSGTLTNQELATMFLEGNTYVLSNLRSLLAMGVSYNADGKTYLEKVAEAAEEMASNLKSYQDDYEETAALIAPALEVFRNMFVELKAYEADMDYSDETFTDEEIKYAEAKGIAEMMREVQYLDGKTLYDFCLEYIRDDEDYTKLFPLAAALNQGQLAMTQVAHYYDVVRYSVTDLPQEVLEAELAEAEKIYLVDPFDIYTGMDRTMFSGSFALTSAADRADAYTEDGLTAAFFGNGNALFTSLNIAVGVGGAAIFAGAIVKSLKKPVSSATGDLAREMASVIKTKTESALNAFSSLTPSQALEKCSLVTSGPEYVLNNATAALSQKYSTTADLFTAWLEKCPDYKVEMSQWNFLQKYEYLSKNGNYLTGTDAELMQKLAFERDTAIFNTKTQTLQAERATREAAVSSTKVTAGVMYLVGGLMMLYSAAMMVYTVVSYYYPKYSDIPLEMVDLLNTADGDRYIKYDVVREAKAQSNGVYAAADVNAFAGERWNALYFTKSYEAGKPLLATFALSTASNKAGANYAPVHRFGETVCYDLNKYNFKRCPSVYLSVKQGEGEKAAVASVPELIGSMFSEGTLLLAGGVGMLLGIGGTLTTISWRKKRKFDQANLEENEELDEGETPTEGETLEQEEQDQAEENDCDTTEE